MPIESLQQALADRYEVYRSVDDVLKVTFYFTDQSEVFSFGSLCGYTQTLPASETEVVRADRVLKYTDVEISYPHGTATNGDLSSQAATTLLELAGKAAAALPASAWTHAGIQPNKSQAARVLAWLVEIHKDDPAFVAESTPEQIEEGYHSITLRKPFLAMKRAVSSIQIEDQGIDKNNTPKKNSNWRRDAIDLVRENPGLTDIKIAEMVSVHRGTLSKCQEYQDAALRYRSAYRKFQEGFHDSINHVTDGIVYDDAPNLD